MRDALRSQANGRNLALLFLQPAKQAVQDRFAILFVDGIGEWDIHRTHFDAVLGVAAISYAIFIHNRLDPLVSVQSAGRVHVEKPHLSYCLWPDIVIALVLRTRFEATAAGHAT